MLKDLMLNLDGHSIFSPSSSAMWLTCSGSLVANMVKRQTEGESGSEFAAEGTVAHELAEKWLVSGRKPKELIGEIKKIGNYDIEITEDMLANVAEYVNWCNDQVGDKYVEVRVDFSHLTPVANQKGTSDHVCCTDGKLTITDLKFGMGVKVYAENNTQMQIYALGAMAEFDALYDFKEIEMRICQPRMNHFDSWVISREELLKFGDYVTERAKKAWSDNADRVPTEKGCQWCKVKATCPAKAAELEAMVDDCFAEDDIKETLNRIDNNQFLEKVPVIQELTIEQQEKILSKSKTVRQFLDTIEKNLFDFSQKGGKLELFKIVAGKKTRSWRNDDETILKLTELGLSDDDFQPRTMASPAAVEKILKRKDIAITEISDLLASRETKPTLVSITDKRPQYVADAGVEWDS